AYSAGDPFSRPYLGPYYSLSPFSAAGQFAAQYANLLNVIPSNQVNVLPNNLTPQVTVNLSSQVAELQSEVKLLQDQLASAQAQAQAKNTVPPPRETSGTERRPRPIALVFNNGARIETTGYAIAGGMLYFLTPTGYGRVDLSN